jgi:phage shock protein A
MEYIPFILILAILAVLVLPIAAIVTANARASALRREMGYLEERLCGMEAQLRLLEQTAKAGAAQQAATQSRSRAASGRSGSTAWVSWRC